MDTTNHLRTQKEITQRSEAELLDGEVIRQLMLQIIPDMGRKWDVHVPAFLTPASLARVLWLNTVYEKSIDVPGNVVEFGSQWGASLNVFLLLKLIHEPWNAGRRILSFSTFSEGFVSVKPEDGLTAQLGDYAVAGGWKESLESLLLAHAARSPIGAKSNFGIFEGDVCATFPQWLEDNPDALISHAHFDMDVYQPTKEALQHCLPRMPKGAILIFDELNCPAFPGETLAVNEVLGIHGLSLKKSKFQPYSAYCIIA